MRAGLLSLLAVIAVAASGAVTNEVRTSTAGDVSIVCADPGTWAFDISASVLDGCDVVTVRLTSPVDAVPPSFDARFETSGADVLQVWTPYDERCQLWPQAWGTTRYESALAFRAPLCAAFDNRDRNRCALAVSDAFHRLNYALTIHERTCRLMGHVSFFQAKESPRKSYEVRLRIDRRDVFWGDAVREAADWVSQTSGLKPADVPEAAFEPLYSTWYAFWQDVRAPEIEREAKAAAALGMKTAILDDGWQKEKSRTYYSATGDWMPVASRFPDMRAHVEKVHAAGLRYMLWLSVPFVGDESKAYARFRGKFLSGDGSDTAVLDPRFPEVREYLLATYERAVRDWGFDGLKLDFIDLFRLPDPDPAVADGYAGRDYRSLPEATDRLMRDVVSRLKAIRTDVLLEFRQQYMGPAIRQYGNMIRATDCPADPAGNRRRIADLRLTSGTTAVHSDMLVWSVDETPENAARSVLSALFGVVQYSMVLGRVPPAHREMMRHWIDFSTRHRSALLKGAIRPHHPEMQYPWIESWDDRERIVAAYVENTVLPVPADGRETILINAAQDASLVVDLAAPAEAEAFDTFGKSAGCRMLAKGLQRVAVPPSGYLVLPASAAAARRPVFVNYDDTHFAHSRDRFGLKVDEAEIRSLVRQYEGTDVSDLLFCIGGRIADVPNKAKESWLDKYRQTNENGVAVCYTNAYGPRIAHELHEVLGLDPYALWIDESRKVGIRPWLSFRLNDCHANWEKAGVLHPNFIHEHPEYRRIRHREPMGYFDRCLDFGIEAVRARELAFVGEMLERYDVDGVELDWQREIYCFVPGRESAETVSAFHRAVRRLADAAAKRRGHPVKVMARVPADPDTALRFGFDVAAWADERLVDVLVPCPRWDVTDNELPVDLWKRLLRKSGVLLAPGVELRMRNPGGKPAYVTPQQLLGAASAFYSQGADALYLFNYFDDPDWKFHPGDAHRCYWTAFGRPGDDMAVCWRNQLVWLKAIGSPEKLFAGSRDHMLTFRDIVPLWGGVRAELPCEIAAGAQRYLRLVTGKVPSGARLTLRIGSAGGERPKAVFVNSRPCVFREVAECRPPLTQDPLLCYDVPAYPEDAALVEIVSEKPLKVTHLDLQVRP